MQKATVYLTEDGAKALKAHMVGRLGNRGINDLATIKAHKAALQAAPVAEFARVETTLPDWSGDIKERAAVGLGLRKKSARFIERVEIL